jgi:hypothetical protein
MAELIAGPTMILTWVYSGGTISLNGDYRTCEWNPSVAYEDVSAGQDTQIGRLPTLKDATASITLVQQTAGTAIVAALAPGNAGTLTIQPEGTASNKRKITLPAYCDGAQSSLPYANVAVLTCGFSGSSALANYTDSVN